MVSHGDRAMRISLFNTLKARDKLVAVDVPEQQATAYVEILAEVASIDIENIATKDYIEERLLLLEARLGKKLCD